MNTHRLTLSLCLVITSLLAFGTTVSRAQGNATATPPLAGASVLVIRVFGRVTNGTAGAKLPDSLKLTLTVTGLSENDLSAAGPKQVLTREGDMAVDGTYTFEKIPAQLGYAYTISARYAGGLQSSMPVTLTKAASELEVPLTVYEASTDPSLVQVSSLSLTLDFSSTPGSVQLLWRYKFAVSGDRLYLGAARTAQGDPASVIIPLPPEAQSVMPVGENASKRYAVDGAGLQDTLPILPGEKHTVTFSYRLPYRDGMVLSQVMPYGAPAADILIPSSEDRIKLTGDGFTPGETQGGALTGDYYVVYSHSSTIPRNGSLTFRLNGSPHLPAPLQSDNGPTLISYFLLGGGLLILALGGFVWLAGVARRKRT